MFSSSSSLSSPPLSIRLHRKPDSITISSSLLYSPNLRKPNSRKNHLRPKLPTNPLPHSPPLILPSQQSDSEFDNLEHQTSESKIFEYEPSRFGQSEYAPSSDHPILHESVDELNVDFQNRNPNIKSFILDVSFRFAALIAVQTAVAVWLFSQRNGREQTMVEGQKDVKVLFESDGKEEADSEFERAVLEIRNMAKEARAKETTEREENVVEKERLFLKSRRLESKSGNAKLGERKKLEFVKSNVGRKNAGKGFNGGVQQNKKQSIDLSVLTEESTDIESSSMVLNEKTSHVVDLHRTIDHKTTHLNHNSGNVVNVNKRVKTRPKKSVGNYHVEDSFVSSKKPWWLKLPYVIAILMRRGPDRNSPKGLYSLEISSPLDSGRKSASYTITFQDHGDATNFCYLLESFFEELDGFSADVVPLTIKEIEQQMKSNGMRFVVVKKDQLQLYAGKPLAEVETALRSLLH